MCEWINHFESKEHVESGRTSGPICMRSPSETLVVVWQSLSVEHVALDNQGNDSEPMKPNLWSLDISDDEVWADDDHFSYYWGGVRVKKLMPRTNMLSASKLCM